MLQKLEAEVRQHIRIEQQLKLYIETTQSKLDDLEKAKDSFNPEVFQQQIEKLKGENGSLAEKLKKRDTELESLRKELKGKVDVVHSLELQVETIPILKNKIKDLEKATTTSQDLIRASATLNIKNLNTSTDNGGRPSTGGSNQAYSSSSNAPIDLRARKTSQQYTASNFPSSQDNSKFKTVLLEKNKENIENMKIDISKKSKVPKDKPTSSSTTTTTTTTQYTKDANERTLRSSSPISYEVLTDQTNIRNNQRSDVQYEDVRKSSISRQEPKIEMRQSVKERPSYNERDNYDERTSSLHYNSRQSRQQLIDEAELNTQKNSVDRSKVSRQKDPEEEFERLQNKVKRNMSQEKNAQLEGQSTLNSCKRTDRSANDAVESPIDYQALKKYIPKPSKMTTQATESQAFSGDLLKGYIKKEASSNIDIHKLKVTSPKKGLQDSRSQSVDATNKYYRTLKSKAENTERPNERDRSEYLATTKTSTGYPPQNNTGKLQGTLNTTQNLSHLMRMNS